MSINTRFAINIKNVDVYKKQNLYNYQHLINKWMYFVYKIKPDITFIICQFSKFNSDLKKPLLSQ